MPNTTLTPLSVSQSSAAQAPVEPASTVAPAVLEKIEKAYDSPSWWYDLRGCLILTFTYCCSLTSVIGFFARNVSANHLEGAVGSGSLLRLILLWRRLLGRASGKIVAFDYAEPMLVGARKRFKGNADVQVERADVAQLRYADNSFDSANVANAMHCFPALPAALVELCRVLKPKGRLAANVLLYPRGLAPSRWLANRINAWGMKKGILETPYERQAVIDAFLAAGFELVEVADAGNTLNIVARKPAAWVGGARKPTLFYQNATGRNLGLISETEQEILRTSTVAICGMGAAGGHHLLGLARLGVERFIIADPDAFDVVNLHRQAGAYTDTLGRSKAEVMAEMARSINPDVRIQVMPVAITEENVEDFLRDADILVDGIDFFEIDARRLILAKARAKGIYTITAGPLGSGSSLHVFSPTGMSFDDYFGMRPGMTRAERLAAFGVGLLPRLPSRGQIDPSRVDFQQKRGPALISAIMICSGIMVTEVMNVLLKRPGLRAIPHSYYFDPAGKRYHHGFARFGRRRLRDLLMRRLALRIYPTLNRLHLDERRAAP